MTIARDVAAIDDQEALAVALVPLAVENVRDANPGASGLQDLDGCRAHLKRRLDATPPGRMTPRRRSESVRHAESAGAIDAASMSSRIRSATVLAIGPVLPTGPTHVGHPC